MKKESRKIAISYLIMKRSSQNVIKIRVTIAETIMFKWIFIYILHNTCLYIHIHLSFISLCKVCTKTFMFFFK